MSIKKLLHRSPYIAIGILVGITLVAIGAVYALSSISTGWRINSGTPGTLDLLTNYGDCRVVTAPSGKSVFVPTKTTSEWGSFKSGAVNAGITIANCTYSWVTGSWGSCSVSCGGGTQTRSVRCRRNSDAAIVADSYCSGVKPATSQSCNTGSCCAMSYAYSNCDDVGVAEPGYCTATIACTRRTGEYIGPNTVYTENGNWVFGRGGSCVYMEPFYSSAYASCNINGQCGSLHGTASMTAPSETASYCIRGRYNGLNSTSGQWKWTCEGIGAGTTANCYVNKQRNQACSRPNYAWGPDGNGATWNTVSSIVQTGDSGGGWSPTDYGTYNDTTPSTTECRFKCKSGYMWKQYTTTSYIGTITVTGCAP